MANKLKGKASSLFGDVDLLDTYFDDQKQPVRKSSNRSGALHRSTAADNIFSMLADEVKKDGGDSESSDVSAADPNDILKTMKDLDDMDADLFVPKKKPSSAPAQTKPFGNKGPKKSSTTLESNEKPGGVDKSSSGERKPNSAPSSTRRNNKRFTFSDEDDPLGDLLDDLLPEETKSKSKFTKQLAKPVKSVDESMPSSSASPVLKTTAQTTTKKRSDLTFDDDKDDVMNALGFDSDQNSAKKKEMALWSNKERSEQPNRTRTRVDEILESLTSPRLLERPPTGENKELLQSKEKQHQEKNTAVKDKQEDDLTFGSYQPTLFSTPEGRQTRRQSVRFSTEDESALEKKPKPTTPTRHRGSADWLGLKTNVDHPQDDASKINTEEVYSNPPSVLPLERRLSLTGSHTTPTAKVADTPSPTDNDLVEPAKTEVSISQKQNEEDDWLSGALSRKKARSGSTPEAQPQMSKQADTLGLGEELDPDSNISKQVTSRAPRIIEDSLPSARETSNIFLGQPNPPTHSTPIREETVMHDRDRTTKAIQSTPAAVQQQVTFTADSLQQLLLHQQQVMPPQWVSLGGNVDAGVLHRLKEQQPGDHQSLQFRIIQLEAQVKTLQLEQDQSEMLLEKIRQRHKQDMELIENAHKARVRLIEESATQRETRMRQECEDLMERLAALTRSAEQERTELQAQYQRKLAQAQQDRDREVERLRDLQRKSILEMKKDYEDQIHRLKKLKDEEIDAVTSATSQTRSLTMVIEQMEQFSSRLGELSSRVESTHENTAHGLEQGARHRDEQLRIMQDRLAQQQKAMTEEKAYLKEILSRMDTQLNEQQRQLEKERWKVTSEQAKAESTQRGLDEERRSLSMQMNMEREELERAKSALLEEQKSVMQHCAEERRKLAAEWAQFHAKEKQRHDRAEREASSLLEKREDSIISLAQERADLKLRTGEVKQKELAVTQERETLDRLREELDREKESISATALRLKTRTQEVEAFSKLAADKFEEGERALRQAKLVEAEHEARLRNIHSQTERLRQQEQQIIQERMLQKESHRQDLPTFSPLQVHTPILPDSPSLMPSTMNILTSANSQMALEASLALWKYTSAKDWEYLEDEKIYLENLKKKSYRSTFNTD